METINIQQKDRYAIVQLNRGKVNAINQQMISELIIAFTELQNDRKVSGVILTGIPRFFSAGLDVIELYGYDKEEISNFFRDFASFHKQLVRFPKPLVCAINGYSPAGGTVFAITADYRIMVEGEKYTMGLNEVAVSIQISEMLIEAYAFWIGRGKAHKYVLEGKLLNSGEALSVGLIDEIVSEEILLPRAEEKIKQYLQADPDILRNTKMKLRKNWLDILDDNGEAELAQALGIWWKPEVRHRMKLFVERLTSKP